MDLSGEDIVARADELYALRSSIASVRESVELLRQVDEQYEVCWRLSRAYFFLGQEASTNDEKQKHHHAGITAGRAAVRRNAGRVEGQFWLGVNLALLAGIATPWRAVALALKAKRTLARAILIDPAYHGAGPHRVMGRLFHQMPQVMGGGPARARKHFEVALKLDPTNTVTLVYFAGLLRDLGEFEASRNQLQAVIDIPPNSAWEFEIARDQRIARELLQ